MARRMLLVTALGLAVSCAVAQTRWEWIAPMPPRFFLFSMAVTGTRAYFLTDENVVFSTFDGGNSFTIYPPYARFDNVVTCCAHQSIAFADSLTGVVVDMAHGEFRTTDGGNTWRQIAQPYTNIHIVVFGSSSVGWKFGDGGSHKTTNAGATWSFFSVPFWSGGVYSRAFALNESRVWVAKSYYYGRPIEGSIWRSTNGGASWSRLNTAIMPDSNTSIVYDDLKFRADGLGFATGRVRRASTGITTLFIQRTTDLGTSWTVQEYPTPWPSWLCPLSDSVWVLLASSNSGGTDSIVQLRTTDAGVTWQSSSPLPSAFTLLAGSIESLHTILVATTNGWYRSNNAGVTYTRLTSNRDYWVTGIAFEHRSSSPAQQIAIATTTATRHLLSTDGGLTWEPKTLPGVYPSYGVRGLRIVEGVIYVVTEPGAMYKSTDLGRTWQRKVIPNYADVIRGFDAYDKNHLALQMSGLLSTSSDGGTTWRSLPISYRLSLNSQQIIEPFRTIGVGRYFDSAGTRGAIFTTSDGGFNWRIEDFPEPLVQVAMITPSRGFVAGNGRLYRTVNGARSWGVAMQEVSRFCFYDSLQGVTRSVNDFYQTNDGGMTWRRSQPIYVPDRVAGSEAMAASQRGDLFAVGSGRLLRLPSVFRPSGSNESPDGGTAETLALYQNSPNPFNPTTTLTFRIPNLKPKTHVTLTVYDMLGREVRTLLDEVLDSGSRSVQFDASGLPSGVYFYRLNAEGRSITRKMILLR